MQNDTEILICYDRSIEPLHRELTQLMERADKLRKQLGYSPAERGRVRYAICGEYEVWQETDGLGRVTITVEDDEGKVYWTETGFEAQLDQLLAEVDEEYPDTPI